MDVTSIPVTADEIDPRWLTAALAEQHPGALVDAVEVIERHEVTNSHARLRVEYATSAGAPETLFCKVAPLDPHRRGSILATGMGVREARFYREVAPSLGREPSSMRVPRAHVARFDGADGTFVLLLEDIFASGCTVSSGPEGVPVDLAAQALDDLAELHLRYRDPAIRAAELPWVHETRPGSSYGAVMLRYGLDHHRERLNDAFAAIAELYIARGNELHALWHEGPKTVIHGDVHVGNVFFDHGVTGFLDWGIINVNTPMREVSYFLTMALAPDDRRRHERDLLRHYLDRWNRGGGDPISWDEAWREHRVHAAYTVAASCQVVTFPDEASARRRVFADAFLERSLAAVEDLDALGALRDAGL